MTLVGQGHADHGATFGERGGRQVVEHYGRPERAVKAVRNAVGVVEMGYGVVVVEGDDRVEFVDNAVSNRVPASDGEGCYALLLDPQGKIETDLFVYNAGERLLLFTPPDRAQPLVDDWSEKVFIQDVDLREATTDFGVFGVHGARSTEKVASVLHHAGAPEGAFSFVRGSMGDAGVTVVATDAPTGEEGYEVICAADDAPEVWDTLLTRGNGAAPFGYQTWETLTLEAGTPLFETELRGRIPNVLGLRSALDFQKGCYVGQEVVSRVENRGQPSRRLVGLTLTDDTLGGADEQRPTLPGSGAAVFDGDEAVGEVTRAAWSPSLDAGIAFAVVAFDCDAERLDVRIDGTEAAFERASLPFVEGSQRSGRIPQY
jgi:aminomethyltransferase